MPVVDRVLERIEALSLEEGERLPSERSLAESCGVSRTSIRNALKDLQSRRILKVKQGSGYFMASKFALEQAVAGRNDHWDARRIHDTMEARRHVEPHVIAISANEITEDSIGQLEACLVALGEATVGHNISAAVQLHRTFLKIIHNHCPNREFIRILSEVRIPHNYTVKVLEAAQDHERSAIFSDHVNLFQHIKHHDTKQIKEACLRINRQAMELFDKYAETIDF